MGLFDGMLNFLKLEPDDDDEFYDDGFEIEEKQSKPAPARTTAGSPVEAREPEPFAERRTKEKPQNKVTPMRTSSRRTQVAGGMEVCVIKPTSFDDSNEITETLLANRTVILNVEGLNMDIAQRIIDFTCGSCFAIHGNLQKISSYIFIVTPENVDISGDFQSLVDTFDFSGI